MSKSLFSALLISVAFASYKTAEIFKRGFKHKLPLTDDAKKFGNEGEHELFDILNNIYPNQYTANRFLDKRKSEIDAIVYLNGYIIVIDMKNWKGKIIDNGDNGWLLEKSTGVQLPRNNELNKLKNKTNNFIRNFSLNSDSVKSLLVFNNECDISHIMCRSQKENICKLVAVSDTIISLSDGRGSIDRTLFETICNLPTWDVVQKNDGTKMLCTIKSIEIEIGSRQVKLEIGELRKIEVCSPLIKLKPDVITIYYRSGEIKKCNVYKGITTIEGYNKPISLSEFEFIELDINRIRD